MFTCCEACSRNARRRATSEATASKRRCSSAGVGFTTTACVTAGGTLGAICGGGGGAMFCIAEPEEETFDCGNASVSVRPWCKTTTVLKSGALCFTVTSNVSCSFNFTHVPVFFAASTRRNFTVEALLKPRYWIGAAVAGAAAAAAEAGGINGEADGACATNAPVHSNARPPTARLRKEMGETGDMARVAK